MRRNAFVALAAAAAVARPNGAGAAGPRRADALAFAAAVAGIEALIAADRADPSIAAYAYPRLYHHGAAVDTTVVLFHGFTNCPQQFDELAQRLHARGCNVYVPRLPLHGDRDRLTHALGGLTVGALADAATASYVAARGLGRHVAAVGLSLGGTMALYLAQTQPLDHAVPIAPFLMPIGVPGWAGMPLMTALSWLPDIYVWWDPRIKQDCLPMYAYPGFPTHALATTVFFGNAIVAAHDVPHGARCTLVTNAHESAVNNAVAQRLQTSWRDAGMGGANVVLDDLGPSRHDIIDPTTFPQARTLVYPRLESIVLD